MAGTISKIQAFFYRLGAGEKELSVPSLSEEFNEYVKVDSETEDTSYYVNMFEYSCTCPDFTKRRYFFERGDIRRICKHQLWVLEDRKLLGQFDELSRAVIELKANKKVLHLCKTGAGAIFSLSSDNEWINVVARKRNSGDSCGVYTGDYARFGFSKIDGRWSYGDAPPGATAIKKAIRDKFGV